MWCRRWENEDRTRSARRSARTALVERAPVRRAPVPRRLPARMVVALSLGGAALLGLGREVAAAPAPPTEAIPCAADATRGLPNASGMDECKAPTHCARQRKDTERIRLNLYGALRGLEPGLEGRRRLLRVLPFGLPAPAEVASRTHRTQALLDRQAPLVRVEAAESSSRRRALDGSLADAAHVSLWPLAPRLGATIAEGVIGHQAIRLGLDAAVRLSPAADALRRRSRRPAHTARTPASTPQAPQLEPEPEPGPDLCNRPLGSAIGSAGDRSSSQDGYACVPATPRPEPAKETEDDANTIACGHGR